MHMRVRTHTHTFIDADRFDDDDVDDCMGLLVFTVFYVQAAHDSRLSTIRQTRDLQSYRNIVGVVVVMPLMVKFVCIYISSAIYAENRD